MPGDWKDILSGALAGAGTGLMMSQMGDKGSDTAGDEAWCTAQGGAWNGTACLKGGQVIKKGLPIDRQYNLEAEMGSVRPRSTRSNRR